MFTAIVERLSGKAALQEEIRIMKLALEQSTNGVAMLTKARNNLSERIKTVEAERDEWKRQNTDLEVRLDNLFVVVQQDDLDKKLLYSKLQEAELEVSRGIKEKAALLTRCDALRYERDALQAKYDHLHTSNEHIAEVDIKFSADYAALQQELQTAKTIIERYAEIPLVALASKSMALLAELYEARQKHGSVKAWDTRYLDLKAQHGQIAPVEAVEAKEE